MCYRLLEYAPSYFNLADFRDGETKRALLKVQNKRLGKSRDGTPADNTGRKNKKQTR